MTLIKWNAKRPSIFSEFDNLFDSFISDFPTSYDRSSSWTPKFEVLNTDNSYRIRADLPGMIKNDVNIEVVNNTLKISGERVNDTAESNDYVAITATLPVFSNDYVSNHSVCEILRFHEIVFTVRNTREKNQ